MRMDNTLKIPDRRKAPRFQVALPVELLEGTGITRDLSVCGVFFETDRIFALGEVIQYTLVLEYIDPRHPVRLQCRGHVVRLELQGNTMGVAVVITACRLDAQSRGSMGARSPTAWYTGVVPPLLPEHGAVRPYGYPRRASRSCSTSRA